MTKPKKQKVPKFDGRPMLWYSPDYETLHIRYGTKGEYKMDRFSDEYKAWVTGMGFLTPSKLIKYGDEFLGYL